MLQNRAAQHHAGQIGLHRQAAADLLHHDHRLHRPATIPAMRLGEGQGQNPSLGILSPHRRIETGRVFLVGLALVKIRVARGEHFADALFEEQLVVAEIEIHVGGP